jgi:hypothetical protein
LICLLLYGVVIRTFIDRRLMIMQGTPVNIIVGSHVWLEDPGEAWVDGVVTEIKGGGDATIATTNGKTVRCTPRATLIIIRLSLSLSVNSSSVVVYPAGCCRGIAYISTFIESTTALHVYVREIIGAATNWPSVPGRGEPWQHIPQGHGGAAVRSGRHDQAGLPPRAGRPAQPLLPIRP